MNIDYEKGMQLLGCAYDVMLNDENYWKGVPESVWKCHIGRNPVIKKWLSYRERSILGRDLYPDEAEHVTDMIQRLTTLILMGDSLDAIYMACRDHVYSWSPR